jgi:hypothetical protein
MHPEKNGCENSRVGQHSRCNLESWYLGEGMHDQLSIVERVHLEYTQSILNQFKMIVEEFVL